MNARRRGENNMKRAVVGLLCGLLAAAVSSCSAPPARVAYNSLDDATTAVQSAVRAYKAHCGVPTGVAGPGTCPAAEYAQAEKVYAQFQATAISAADIAARTGQTPLQVISSAAAEAITLLSSLGVKP